MHASQHKISHWGK